MPRPPHSPTDIDIDPGPNNIPAGTPIFIPTTNLPFLTIDSFSNRLPDNDWINIVIEASDLPNDRLEIKLRTRPGMWFKGIEAHSGGGVVKLEAENGATTGSYTLSRASFSDVSLIFVKAKEFGIHHPVYELAAGRLEPVLGKRIIFDWMQD